MRFRVLYKDRSSQLIRAATYDVGDGYYRFKDEDGRVVAKVLFGEVRSITEEGPPGLA